MATSHAYDEGCDEMRKSSVTKEQRLVASLLADRDGKPGLKHSLPTRNLIPLRVTPDTRRKAQDTGHGIQDTWPGT